MDNNFIQLQASLQCRIFYDTTLVSVYCGSFSCRCLQILQNSHSRKHFLNGIGAQQVEIDEIEFVGIFPFITLRPFFGIADGSHTFQVDCRSQMCGIVVFYQIGKRQVRCV
ncbi:hypothetical protein SDC9_73605 [bioreactor metagenome]|uniref:Uncharacterized protein n=1 Tax=bioreactor metagenome TaxID=1076179 RepID=A0A644YF79_9ZZZZ